MKLSAVLICFLLLMFFIIIYSFLISVANLITNLEKTLMLINMFVTLYNVQSFLVSFYLLQLVFTACIGINLQAVKNNCSATVKAIDSDVNTL
jgi:hypothetical protein